MWKFVLTGRIDMAGWYTTKWQFL